MARTPKQYHRPFNDYQMRLLTKRLEESQLNEKPDTYEVRIDGVIRIPRTVDPDKLGQVWDEIEDQTEEVEIRVYYNGGNQPDSFYLKVDQSRLQPEAGNGLSGVEIDQRIAKAIEDTRRGYEMQGLREENDKLKGELSEFEQYAEKLETELKEFRGKKLHWGKVNLGELGSVVVEGMLRRNPQWLSGLPGGEALAGVISEENEQMQNELPQAATAEAASFAAVEDRPGLGEEEMAWLGFLEKIRNDFSQANAQTFTRIVHALSENPSLIPLVWELLESPQSQTSNKQSDEF